MSVILPSWPAPKEIVPRLFVTGGLQTTATESDDNWLDRLGSRYSVDFTMRPMTYDQAAEWSDLEETGANVVMPLRQPGVEFVSAGSPTVDGSGQSGSNIALKGLTPYFVIRRRQWLPIITGGQRYCYRAKAEVIADASGDVVVPIRPMLRKPHLNNDVVEIDSPKIEGIATLSEDAWGIQASDRHIYLAFTIRERA